MAIVSDRKMTYEKKITQIQKLMEVGTFIVVNINNVPLFQIVNILWDTFINQMHFNCWYKHIRC
jgi:hypothetical protein